MSHTPLVVVALSLPPLRPGMCWSLLAQQRWALLLVAHVTLCVESGFSVTAFPFPPIPEMVVSLQKQFSVLVDPTPTPGGKKPSSFQFNWTEEDTNRTCFHGHSLQGVLSKKGQSLLIKNSLYWLSTQKFCRRYVMLWEVRPDRLASPV